MIVIGLAYKYQEKMSILFFVFQILTLADLIFLLN